MSKLTKYAGYENVLKEVYEIAVQRRNVEPDDVDECIRNRKPYNDMVYNYLMEQDMETVKVVQTIMYLGRDYQYPEESEVDIEKNIESLSEGMSVDLPEKKAVTDPDALIDEYMKDLGKAKGWETLSIEAHQISSKAPLDRYLKRAFEILGI